MSDGYSNTWRWIERAIWEKDMVKSALSCLKHSPYAPWNRDDVEWDTSHKSYDAEIQSFTRAPDPRIAQLEDFIITHGLEVPE